MKRTAYQPPEVFVPAGKSYSHGVIVEAGRTLYVAGQTSRDVQGNVDLPFAQSVQVGDIKFFHDPQLDSRKGSAEGADRLQGE